MADYIVKDTELTSVANAIRTAGGTNSLLSFPNGFISAVNNISGSSGLSDFSTANVTITFSTNDSRDTIYSPVIIPAGGSYEGALTTLIIPGSAMASQMQYTVPLHNGQCIITTQIYSNTVEVSMSGAVEAISTSGRYLVTGDGTLSIIKSGDDDNPK